MPKLKDIAKACKSKNAGPYELTLDIMFEDAATFDKVRKTGVICPELIARLYHVPVASVVFTEFAPAHAYKATIESERLASAAGAARAISCRAIHAKSTPKENPRNGAGSIAGESRFEAPERRGPPCHRSFDEASGLR